MRYLLIMLIAGMSAAGCLRMKVDPIEVKPITLNVNLRIDRELDDFFDFEHELAPAHPAGTPSTTQAPAVPATPEVITTQPTQQ